MVQVLDCAGGDQLLTFCTHSVRYNIRLSPVYRAYIQRVFSVSSKSNIADSYDDNEEDDSDRDPNDNPVGERERQEYSLHTFKHFIYSLLCFFCNDHTFRELRADYCCTAILDRGLVRSASMSGST